MQLGLTWVALCHSGLRYVPPNRPISQHAIPPRPPRCLQPGGAVVREAFTAPVRKTGRSNNAGIDKECTPPMTLEKVALYCGGLRLWGEDRTEEASEASRSPRASDMWDNGRKEALPLPAGSGIRPKD